MYGLPRDLRLALRSAAKNPGFTALTVSVLSIGIGASTAIFSVVHGILLRSLPYEEPDRIVRVWGNSTEGDTEASLRVLELQAFEHNTSALERVGGMYPIDLTLLSTDGEASRISGAMVTTDYFAVFGTRPATGRFFSRDEIESGQDRVTVVSHGFWMERMGGDPRAVGRSITLSEESFVVIGVLPRSFRPLIGTPSVYIPYRLGTEGWIGRWLHTYARLRPGVEPARATDEMNALMTGLGETERRSNGWQVTLVSLTSDVVGHIRPTLLLLMASVAAVLLIACANVANLLLARASTRDREIAVRLALGANRWQVVRQALVESTGLALTGGAVGVAGAYAAVQALVRLAPTDVPRLDGVTVNGTVLVVALATAVAGGILAGVSPAVYAARGLPATALGSHGRGTSKGRRAHQVLGALVVGEIALTVSLLVSAGLVIRSFVAVHGVETGFSNDAVVAMALTPPGSKYGDRSQVLAYFDDVVQHVSALRGVQGVGIGSNLPLSGRASWMAANSEQRWAAGNAERIPALQRVVQSSFFEALEIPVIEGRLFDSRDGPDAPARVLINQTLARRLWPGESAVGKRITTSRDPDADSWIEVVGVVGDVKYQTLEAEPEPQVYEPHRQRTWRSMVLFARGSGDTQTLLAAVHGAVRAFDPGVPISGETSLAALVDRAVAGRRFSVSLFTAFGAVALGLSLAGVYGVLSFAVSQRRREMGIRMALGARSTSLIGLVMRRGVGMLVGGAVAGLLVSFAAARGLESLLYEVHPVDPVTFVGVPIALAVTVLLASLIPARRASRVDPMTVLRQE